MKNITTPRTLAECSFTVGHPAIICEAPRRSIVVRLIVALCRLLGFKG